MSTYAEDNITITSQKSLNDKVDNVNQYFWYEETGTHAGAHITEIPQDDFKTNPQGGNLHATSTGLSIKKGNTELANFTANGVSLAENISEGQVDFFGGLGGLKAEHQGTAYSVYLEVHNASAEVDRQFVGLNTDCSTISATKDENNYGNVGIAVTDSDVNTMTIDVDPTYIQLGQPQNHGDPKQIELYADEINANGISLIPVEYTPTWESGETPSRYSCIKQGGICNFYYMGANKAHAENASIGTLPEGCRPNQLTYIPFVKFSSSERTYGALGITVSGLIFVAWIASASVSGRIYANGFFPSYEIQQ